MQTSVIFKYYCFAIIVVTTFVSCQSSSKDIYSELEKFDNSLDSLIKEETYSENRFLIFQADTLYNNPTLIEETCYQVIGKDSIRVDANCHLYTFSKSHLITNSSEDFLGHKFVQKFIYFKDKINNKEMENLRLKRSDTIYFGRLKKYNAKGYVVKSIESHESQLHQVGKSIVTNDYRLLEIFRYHDNSVTTWTKRYFNKKYNIDSLRNSKTTQLTTSKIYDAWEADKNNYSYVMDRYGNWTAKVKKGENPDVYYRKYTYKNDID